MDRAYPAAVLLLLLALPVLTGCGGSPSQPAGVSSVARPSVVKTTASSVVNCSDARGTIQLLVTGQQKYEASQQSVSDGVNYLVVLNEGVSIIKVEGWANNANQLGQHLAQFVTDANALTNGSTDQPQTVEADVATLATECDVAQS
jgi:hypothetical protein